MGGSPASGSRRRFLACGLAAALFAAGPAAAPAQDGAPGVGRVVVVSRDRILRESAAARRLRDAEAEMTEKLQRQIDGTKADFAAEEAELARLRGELPEAEFESRVAAFDQRVRLARRGAQERAAALQKGFQDARAIIAAALPGLMERLRVESGAAIVLNADQVLALEPAVDLSDRAIALVDAEGPSPPTPRIELDAPLFQTDTAPPEERTGAGEAAGGEPGAPAR